MIHQYAWFKPPGTHITTNVRTATSPKITQIPSFINSQAWGRIRCETWSQSHTVLHPRNDHEPCNEHHEPNVVSLGTWLLHLLKWASPTDTRLRGSGWTSRPHCSAECWALLSQYGPYTGLGAKNPPHSKRHTHVNSRRRHARRQRQTDNQVSEAVSQAGTVPDT